MNDQELDQILTSLREEGAPQFGSISRRVMVRIESEPRRRYWMPLAAAAALASIFLMIPRTPEQRLPIEEPAAPEAPAIAWTKPQAPKVQIARARGPILPAIAKVKTGPLEVRMQTDDPDVIIIWLVDGDEGDKEKQ